MEMAKGRCAEVQAGAETVGEEGVVGKWGVVASASKTSLAHLIAEESSKEGMLLLSFFFKAGEQSHPDHLFSGMARSLATVRGQHLHPHVATYPLSYPTHNPAYRSYLISTIQEDLTLATASFPMQFEKLVVEPFCLKALPSDGPGMVIIDALDECEEQAFKYLAKILWEQVPKLPPSIKFLVTSRQFGLLGPYLSNHSIIGHLSINLSDDTNVRDCNMINWSKTKHPSSSYEDAGGAS
ncbi:uncharacterized protein EI90DRAFT_3021062 [Cantharellus anzutake]|uniref:uncharacterized protein n=1 Tax=Cantharellus anzutake TaxID=1750568 RepID=UPI0019049221|nr:uncharacterized protein EI90DRAFT_3021062 [Cantharellus anzutake]KAF8318342.1 hypothetical protein EI90DRAFT_3021062 [Cantharellus anzutake]